MTLEEKIAHLQATSMEQARLEGNVIIDTHQAALEKVFEDHKAEATRQSETRIKAEAANAKLSLNQALAKSQLEIKRRQSKIQQELKDKIFEEADALIDEFMKTEAYDDFLIKCIRKAVNFAGTMMFSRIARMSFHAAENPRSFSEADGSHIIPQGRSCPLYVIQNAAAPARQRIRSVGISPHSVSAGGISVLSATASARFSIIAGSSVRSSCAHLAAADSSGVNLSQVSHSPILQGEILEFSSARTGGSIYVAACSGRLRSFAKRSTASRSPILYGVTE